jgi:hypothetical protein
MAARTDWTSALISPRRSATLASPHPTLASIADTAPAISAAVWKPVRNSSPFRRPSGNASCTPSAATRAAAPAAQWSSGTSLNAKPVSGSPAMASVQPVAASARASSLSTSTAAW